MRIENLTGDGSWHNASLPPDSGTYYVRIKNLTNGVDVDIRLADNPTEIYTIEQILGTAGWFFMTPMQASQLEVRAASSTIQIFYSRYR